MSAPTAPPAKRMRVEGGGGSDVEEAGVAPRELVALDTLRGLRIERVLRNSSDTKTAALLASFENDGDRKAVVLLAKKFFRDEDLTAIVEGDVTALHLDEHNDVYHQFSGTPPPTSNTIKVNIIYPAGEREIAKYTPQERVVVRETPQMYTDVTRPWMEALPARKKQWVYNILEHTQEAERIMLEMEDERDGFIMLPDFKWDAETAETLYAVVLTHRRDLLTIRDLTANELPLLHGIRERCVAYLEEKWGLGADKLRIYAHYQPTFYHLHFHIAHVHFIPPGSGLNVDRAVLLDDIIDNIERCGSHYQDAALTYTCGVNDRLYHAIAAAQKSQPAPTEE